MRVRSRSEPTLIVMGAMSWVDVAKRRQLLAAHPAISDAVLAHTDGVLRVRESIRDASKLLAKEERYRAFKLFAC